MNTQVSILVPGVSFHSTSCSKPGEGAKSLTGFSAYTLTSIAAPFGPVGCKDFK